MCPHRDAVALVVRGHQRPSCGGGALGQRGALVAVRAALSPRQQGSCGPSHFHTPCPGGGWTPGAPSLQGLAGQARGPAAGTIRPVGARSAGIASPQSHVPSMASPTAVPRTSIAAAHRGAGAAGARREGVSADTGLWPLPAAGALLLVLCPASRRVPAASGRRDAASASRRGQVQSAGCRVPPLPSAPRLWKRREVMAGRTSRGDCWGWADDSALWLSPPAVPV